MPPRVWVGPSGTWEAWQKEQQPSHHGGGTLAGLAVGLAGAAYGLARGTGWVLENTLFRPQQGSKDAAVQDVRSANNMNDATQPQHFTLRSGSSTSGSPTSSRALSVWLPCSGAVQPHARFSQSVLRVVSRCHVAGVAGLQLVVQALHQFILGSGGDYLHASLQTTRILSRTLKEARRPRCPGPTGRSWAEAGSAGTVGTGQSCGNLLGSSAGTEAESLATAQVCRILLTSGTSFIHPETIKIAFRVRNTDATNPLAPATPNPACLIQRVQVFANGQRCDDINYYGRTVAVHDLLKGREYNRNKAMEGFDEVNDPRIAHAVHQNGYADVLLRPTMVGILRCGKMLPPQLNLVLEIEFADAATALWSENAGAHPAGATLSTDFEIQNVRVLASQVVLDSALVESFNRVLLSGRSLVFSYFTAHTQQSTVPPGVAEHNVTVARAFTKLMGAFVTFWDNDAGSKIHLLANPGQDVAPIGAVSWTLRCSWAACSTLTTP